MFRPAKYKDRDRTLANVAKTLNDLADTVKHSAACYPAKCVEDYADFRDLMLEVLRNSRLSINTVFEHHAENEQVDVPRSMFDDGYTAETILEILKEIVPPTPDDTLVLYLDLKFNTGYSTEIYCDLQNDRGFPRICNKANVILNGVYRAISEATGY